jgi:hypothetical protein
MKRFSDFYFSGILLWFPIPFMRNVPIRLAKKLGDTTATYRWFAIVYIIASFFLIPISVFAISLAGWYILRLNFIQNKLCYLGMYLLVYLVRFY